MTELAIEELRVPASIDDPDAGDFIEMVRLRNEIVEFTFGNDELTSQPVELLPTWLNPFEPQTCLIAKVTGRIVARAIYQPPIEEGSKDAWLRVEVHPAFRRKGIGSTLYERLVELRRADGRNVEQIFLFHGRSDDSEQLLSPTGFGSVPLNNPETQFLLHRGYRLEQVERISRLTLPVDERELAEAIETAREAAGSEYRLVRWSGRTPEKWLSQIALLHQRMSTDAPSANLDASEEVWDEDRVRNLDDRWRANPRTILTVAAEHVPSGQLAGFTELSVPLELDRPVAQDATLVLREHRGHRLGMLTKLSNLQYLTETHPGHPSVTTFNAEENRPMLDVNEAIGFVGFGYGGGWKKEQE